MAREQWTVKIRNCSPRSLRQLWRRSLFQKRFTCFLSVFADVIFPSSNRNACTLGVCTLMWRRIYGAVLAVGGRRAARHLDKARRQRALLSHPETAVDDMCWTDKRCPAGGKEVVWMHGCSVGEALCALPLIRGLDRAGVHVVLTTRAASSTAAVPAAVEQAGLAAVTTCCYAPWDLPEQVDAFLDKWNPAVAVLIESDLYPNHVLRTAERGIPLMLANATISRKSAQRWSAAPKWVSRVLRQMLQTFDVIVCPSQVQKQRIRELGGSPLAETDDLKVHSARMRAPGNSQRRKDHSRPCWVAASTHQGEESVVAAVHKAAKLSVPSLLTIIAPRHPERCIQVAKELQDRFGLAYVMRTATPGTDMASVIESVPRDVDVLIIDTLGELVHVYGECPVAFVGASLRASSHVGVHNVYEALAAHCILLHGSERGGDAVPDALVVTDVDDFSDTLLRALQSDVSPSVATGASSTDNLHSRILLKTLYASRFLCSYFF